VSGVPPMNRHGRVIEWLFLFLLTDAKGKPATHGNGVQAGRTPLLADSSVAACRRVIIVGAGGFGREVLEWARAAWGDAASRIAGFLSAEADRLEVHAWAPPILGDPASFMPRAGDGFVLAIGIPGVRRRVAEGLLARGAAFLSLVHPTAIVASTAAVGVGSVVCPYAIVSDSCRLGRFTLLNYHSSLGHDASTGDYAVFSPYAALAGGARADDDVFLGMHATVGPGRTVGQRTKVSANSCALVDVPADSLVHGVPGRVQPLVAVDHG
jgi:sugar O-acyltransferase (sialic acid O-acetyltransferase NeuD family)